MMLKCRKKRNYCFDLFIVRCIYWLLLLVLCFGLGFDRFLCLFFEINVFLILGRFLEVFGT